MCFRGKRRYTYDCFTSGGIMLACVFVNKRNRKHSDQPVEHTFSDT